MKRPEETLSDTDRRSFLRHAGLAGFCACGMAMTTAIDATAETRPGHPGGETTGRDPQTPAPAPLAQEWVATLLPLLAAGDRERARTVIRNCWTPHYESLGMQVMIDKFRGDLNGFLRHLQAEWGWLIRYSPEQALILVDENKATCVCPVVPKRHTGDLGLLCHCSEGFAERMFSLVVGRPVRVEVVASVLRGDPTCRYRIDLTPR